MHWDGNPPQVRSRNEFRARWHWIIEAPRRWWHVTSTGTFFEAMFRGQGRPGNTAGGAGNAFDFEKSTNFVKKNRLFSPHLVHVRAEGVGARGPIFRYTIVACAAPRPQPRPNSTWAPPPGRSASQGPLSGSVCGGFIARLGRKITPAPPAVYAHSAAPARPLTPKGRAGTATCAPATCQISLATQMVTRKNEIFRFGLLLLLRYV